MLKANAAVLATIGLTFSDISSSCKRPRKDMRFQTQVAAPFSLELCRFLLKTGKQILVRLGQQRIPTEERRRTWRDWYFGVEVCSCKKGYYAVHLFFNFKWFSFAMKRFNKVHSSRAKTVKLKGFLRKSLFESPVFCTKIYTIFEGWTLYPVNCLLSTTLLLLVRIDAWWKWS